MKTFDLEKLQSEGVALNPILAKLAEPADLAAARVALAAIPGVVGTGIGADHKLMVYVHNRSDCGSIPAEIRGLQTQVEVVGAVRAL